MINHIFIINNVCACGRAEVMKLSPTYFIVCKKALALSSFASRKALAITTFSYLYPTEAWFYRCSGFVQGCWVFKKAHGPLFVRTNGTGDMCDTHSTGEVFNWYWVADVNVKSRRRGRKQASDHRPP